MADFINTVSATVLRPAVSAEVDGMGDPIPAEPTKEPVDGLLFDPGSTSDVAQAMNMRGVEVDAEFHFPKSYTASLRGCSIAYADHTYKVIGNPQPYMDANTPGPWNRPVQVREVD